MSPRFLSDFMSRHPQLNWLAGAAAGLLLTAFTDGLSELVQHAFGRVATFAVQLSTLGIDALRDGLYERAAVGATRAHVSRSAFLVLAVLLPMVWLSLAVGLASERRSQVQRTKTSIGPRTVQGAALFGCVAVLIVSGFALLRATYVYSLADYEERLVIVLAPRSNDAQLKLWARDFRSVSSRSAYLDHISKLEQAAAALSVARPPRPPMF